MTGTSKVITMLTTRLQRTARHRMTLDYAQYVQTIQLFSCELAQAAGNLHVTIEIDWEVFELHPIRIVHK